MRIIDFTPNNDIVHGDCIQVMRRMHADNCQPDLLFADPPFNIGQEYEDHDDDQPWPQYWEWLAQLTELLFAVSHNNGVVCLHGNDRLCEWWLQHMATTLTGPQRIAWIIWTYNFGQYDNTHSNWTSGRAHCLVYSKSGKHTWNPDPVMVESVRKQMGDKRTANDGRRVPADVWGLPTDGTHWGRVQGNNRERWNKDNGAEVDHPNQLPENYLERIIRAYSNPGDLVFDPCAGSGTTAVVAEALDRDWIVCDISAACCLSIEKRLKRGAIHL